MSSQYKVTDGREEEFVEAITPIVNELLNGLEKSISSIKSLSSPVEQLIGLDMIASYQTGPEFSALVGASIALYGEDKVFDLAERIGMVEDAEEMRQDYAASQHEVNDFFQILLKGSF